MTSLSAAHRAAEKIIGHLRQKKVQRGNATRNADRACKGNPLLTAPHRGPQQLGQCHHHHQAQHQHTRLFTGTELKSNAQPDNNGEGDANS